MKTWVLAAPAPTGNAPAFNDETNQRINQLVADIRTRALQVAGNRWFTQEEQLLTLLRGEGMTHGRIAEVRQQLRQP